MAETISREQLQEALHNGTVAVVDALPQAPYQRRHLPGAVNLPAEDIARARDVLPDGAAAIVVYSTDSACTRGPELAALLDGLGYRDVRVYAAGIEDWVSAGLPVDTSAS